MNTTNFEKRRKVRQNITEKVEWMMTTEKRIAWSGTKTDLIEVIHIAYLEGSILEPNGMMARFSYLLQIVFSKYDFTLPVNPRKVVTRIMNKKGIRSRTVEDILMDTATPESVWREFISIL